MDPKHHLGERAGSKVLGRSQEVAWSRQQKQSPLADPAIGFSFFSWGRGPAQLATGCPHRPRLKGTHVGLKTMKQLMSLPLGRKKERS